MKISPQCTAARIVAQAAKSAAYGWWRSVEREQRRLAAIDATWGQLGRKKLWTKRGYCKLRTPRPSKPTWHDRAVGRDWINEVFREQDAVSAIDECWAKHPILSKTAEERRAYGAAAARRRHARLKHTPEWKIRAAARNAVARIARMVGVRRAPRTRTQQYLGRTYDFARAYLAARFKQGMSWENHGTVWHIDHIKPLARFDLRKPSERKRAMHYTNLQPLFVGDNRHKSAKFEQQQELPV